MTMPPTDASADPILHSHIWVPVDDTNVVNWCISWHPNRALTSEERDAMVAGESIHALDYAPPTNEPYGDIRPRGNRHNDYLIDWEAHRSRRFFGVPGVGMQDDAITESQPPLYRTRERLGHSDIAIIRVRKRLLDAALALQERGTPPPGLDPATYAIRPVSIHLPPDVPWTEGAKARLMARQT
jgi:phthalate 4,5-dioxygenase oxygenase subunit